jgi:hypothetical protein
MVDSIAETEFGWGPAMAALTDKQRLYVLAMAADPFGNPSQWAREAGYSTHMGQDRIRGHELSHNPAIERAVREYAGTALGTLGPMLAAAGLLRIARKPDHPDHLKALTAIANRVGMNETTEHKVRVEHTDLTGQALLNRIAALANKHGLDAAKLLGANVPHETPEITVEYQEVTPDVQPQQRSE